ncbi:MAG: alpha/beta fold hydrolase [Roseibacillus sp.]
MKPLLYLGAFLALLLTSCSVQPPLPPEVRTPSTLVVVHGLYANANHVRPIKEGLASAGFTSFAPNLTPNNGSTSIESLAQQLGTYIDQHVPANAPIQIVAHSMGGLVALQYLQDPQTAVKCRGLYTIATPHNGTLLASFHGGPAGRQMVSNSSFLQKLNARRPSFPVTTYRTTNDLVIIPSSSSILPFADNQTISSGGHNEILQSSELLFDLTRRIQEQDS